MHVPGSFTAPTLTGPGSFYVTGEDNLRLVVRNAGTGVICTVEGRFLSLAGFVLPFVHVLTPTTDRQATTVDFRLGDGWILNATIRVTTGTVAIGETFAQLRVIRGIGGATITIGTLLQGYVTEADDLAWPGSAIRASVDGPGVIRYVTITNVAAGTNWTLTQTARTRWRPLTINATLTASAIAANREATLRIRDSGGVQLALVPSGVTQVASQARSYTWFHASNRGAGAIALDVIAPLPMMLTTAGSIFSVLTDNIDVGDDWGEGRMVVEEWIEV